MMSPQGDPLNMIGFEPVVVTGDEAVGLTMPENLRPKHALIQVKGAAIRWLAIPGDEPNGLMGFYVAPGGHIDWLDVEKNYAAMIENVKFIAVTTDEAELEVGYFA